MPATISSTMVKRKFRPILLSALLVILSLTNHAQDTLITSYPTQPVASIPANYKIAIFAPLYLDSAFDATGAYRYGKEFPRFMSPGLEFYEGVQLALDSLGKEGAPVEAYVFDTRSSNQPLKLQLESPEMNDVQMIIAYCSGPEIATFAYEAALKKIPFINVNLPIDGGVYNNPYYVILNSTLKTHIEGIYRYLQKYYSIDPIIVFRMKGQMENVIKGYFDEFGNTTVGAKLPIKFVDLPRNFNAADITKHIPPGNSRTVCIAGTLDESFGITFTSLMAQINTTIPVTVIGMPTWDGTREFAKPEYKGLEIIYSTPFYNSRMDTVSKSISKVFNNSLYARPSDMVMRGYEATWRFTKLLMHYKTDISSNLTRKEYNVFRDFDIQPVFLNKENMTLDYFENKKLFFIKWTDGLIKVN